MVRDVPVQQVVVENGEADMGGPSYSTLDGQGRTAYPFYLHYRIEQARTHTHPVAVTVSAVESRRVSSRLLPDAITAERGEDGAS